MGETFDVSNNAFTTTNTTSSPRLPHTHRPATTPLTEDDDEPPSSGPTHPSNFDDIKQAERDVEVTDADDVEKMKKPGGHKNKEEEYDAVPPALRRGGFGMYMPFLRRKKTTTGAPRSVIGDPELGSPTVQRSNTARSSHVKPPNRFKALFTPVHPIQGPPPTWMQSLKATLRYSPLNICLVFIPISWGLHLGMHGQDTMVFVFSALGIIPLAALLGFGTEQIALKTSMSFGGLLNATLGNIVEMIIAGIALKEVRTFVLFDCRDVAEMLTNVYSVTWNWCRVLCLVDC